MFMKLFVKLSLLILALAAVVYSMRKLNSPEMEKPDSDGMLSLLTGADQKAFNWCPADTIKVEVLSGDGQVATTLTSPADISGGCELLIGGFHQPTSEVHYQPLLRAYGKSGAPVSLEKAQEAGIFRVQGMPFASPMLEKFLNRLNKPQK